MSERASIEDSETTLVYIHIGKCGGTSLGRSIRRSPVVSDRFRTIVKVHTRKPPVLPRARYLIVVRNPVERAISAFNWRYKLVVEDRVQANRFKGEHDVLAEYKSLNALADVLYDGDGNLDPRACRQYRAIHHLKEDIAFYLDTLLPNLDSEQLFAVLATETLDQDIADILGVDRVPRMNANGNSVPDEKKWLSDTARMNLRRFLAEDYACVEKLMDLAGCPDARRRMLLA